VLPPRGPTDEHQLARLRPGLSAVLIVVVYVSFEIDQLVIGGCSDIFAEEQITMFFAFCALLLPNLTNVQCEMEF